MKKFKYTIAFDAGSTGKRDLIFDELSQLGYSKKAVGVGTVAATGFNGNPHEMTSFCREAYVVREMIPNKDTFLALAAMVDDDKFYKGEWVVCNEDHSIEFTKNKLYEVREDGLDIYNNLRVVRDDKGSKTNGWNYKRFRKATKEEIINHFKGGKVSSVAIDTETAPLSSWCSPPKDYKLRSPAEILSGKSWYEATQSKFYDDRIYAAGLAFQTSKPRYDKGFVTLGGLIPKTAPDITFITKSRPKKHKILTF